MANPLTFIDRHNQPELTLDYVAKALFVHDGQAHPVGSASDETFRGAVQSLASRRWLLCPPLRSIWLASRLDIIDRWFILCALADAGRPMTLYGSRQEAERALGLPDPQKQEAFRCYS